MRSAKVISILGFVLLLTISLLSIGCGSDDSPTTTVGSLTNPEFVAVQEQVESLIDSTLNNILSGMNSMGSIAAGGNVDPILYGPGYPDTDEITITYLDGWHVVNLVFSNAGFAYNVLDSIQFYANDEVSQTGVDSDSMWFRHHWSYDVADKDVSYTTFEGASGFDFRGLNDAQAIIDGSNDYVVDNQFVSQDSTVVRHFEFATDVNDLAVTRGPSGWDQSCPNSGVISTTVNMTYSKDDAVAVDTEWTVTMVFTDGSAAVTVSTGDIVWNYTSDVCTALN